MNEFVRQLSRGPVLLDGAMGTLLLARGITLGRCLEALVVEQPEMVTAIHAEYLDAGADLIKTHTFGANRARLAYFGLAEKTRAFNLAAVKLAHSARSHHERTCWIAGNVGPLGVPVVWTGEDAAAEMEAEVEKVFAEQIIALADGGVDLLLFETFSDVEELACAVRAARRVTNLPIVASMSYDAQQQTLANQSVAEATARLVALGVEVIGANCSVGPLEMVETLRQMREAAPAARVSVAPNAGLPMQDADGGLCYPIGPEEFAQYGAAYVARGAGMVGGCCGTTPTYTRGLRAVLVGASR